MEPRVRVPVSVCPCSRVHVSVSMRCPRAAPPSAPLPPQPPELCNRRESSGAAVGPHGGALPVSARIAAPGLHCARSPSARRCTHPRPPCTARGAERGEVWGSLRRGRGAASMCSDAPRPRSGTSVDAGRPSPLFSAFREQPRKASPRCPPPHTSHSRWSIPPSGQRWRQRGVGGSGAPPGPAAPHSSPRAPGASQTLSRERCDSGTPPAPQLCPGLRADPSRGSFSMPTVSPCPAARCPACLLDSSFPWRGAWDGAAPGAAPPVHGCPLSLPSRCFRAAPQCCCGSGTVCAPGLCHTPVPQFPSCWAELYTQAGSEPCRAAAAVGFPRSSCDSRRVPSWAACRARGEGSALCTLICFFPRSFWAVVLLPPSTAELEPGKHMSLLGCRAWGPPSVVASLGAS